VTHTNADVSQRVLAPDARTEIGNRKSLQPEADQVSAPPSPSVISTRSLLRVATILLTLFVLMTGNLLAGQSASPTDLQFHKFQPKVSEQAASSAPSQGTLPNGISVTAAQQMQALQREKYSRTPAQQKVDSNVLYTIRMLAGKEAAPGVPYLYTGVDLDVNNDLGGNYFDRIHSDGLKRYLVKRLQQLGNKVTPRADGSCLTPLPKCFRGRRPVSGLTCFYFLTARIGSGHCGLRDAPDHWEIIRFGWKTPALMMTAGVWIQNGLLLENI
jgi:hypothetical protein